MLIAVDPMLFHILRCEKYHRNMAYRRGFLQLLAELHSIHHRHHHIADHDVWHILQSQIECFLTICCRKHDIVFCKDIAYILADIRVVINDKQRRLAVFHSPLALCVSGICHLSICGCPAVNILDVILYDTVFGIQFLRARQKDTERGAFSQLALYYHSTIVQLCIRLHNSQSDTCAAF